MKIYYDFEIELSKPIHGLTGMKYRFFNRMRELIEERLNIFKDDIIKEEAENEYRSIIIKVLNPKEPSIFYHDYSRQLTEKMIASCDNDFILYAQQKVSEELGLSGLNFPN